MMKLITLLITLPTLLLGQSFQFMQHDTQYTGSAEAIYLYGDIINLTDGDLNLSCAKSTNQVPDAWTASMCVLDICYPPFLEQVTFTLPAGDTTEFSLDVFPNGEQGTGDWTIYVSDTNSGQLDSTRIIVESVAVSIDADQLTPTQFSLSEAYPNPTNASVNFQLNSVEQGQYILTLFSLDGRQVAQRSYHLSQGTNHIQWHLGDTNSGQYLLEVQGLGQREMRKVSVIK